MDADGAVLEEFSYGNRYDEIIKTAKRCKAKYDQCQAVCESTGNLWIRTADACEKVGVPLQLANTYKPNNRVCKGQKGSSRCADASTPAAHVRHDLAVLQGNIESNMAPRLSLVTAENMTDNSLLPGGVLLGLPIGFGNDTQPS